MRIHRRVALLLLLLTILLAGCDDAGGGDAAAIEISDEQLTVQAGTWVNSLGLMQNDPGVWRERIERACIEGVWDRDAAMQLAEEFIEEDLATSVRAQGSGPPSVVDGARALWTMAVNACRDAFPAGAIEDGPPSP